METTKERKGGREHMQTHCGDARVWTHGMSTDFLMVGQLEELSSASVNKIRGTQND